MAVVYFSACVGRGLCGRREGGMYRREGCLRGLY